MTYKETIAGNFDRAAQFYDRYADVQNAAAAELLNCLGKTRLAAILELGCGTGNYTVLLRNRYRDAAITAVDLSKKMVAAAAKKLNGGAIEFVVADAEKFNCRKPVDLVTSNACFQWFENLERALLKYKDLLNDGGRLAVSLFGPLTFRELNDSLKEIPGNIAVGARGFESFERTATMFRKHFHSLELKEKIYEETLPDLRGFLRKISYTGTRGPGLTGEKVFAPGFFKKLEEVYLKKFGRIKVTYQVFFCRGGKR